MSTQKKDPINASSLGQDSQAVSLQDLPKTVMELDFLGCIRISGVDAAEFLQSQFTNDVEALQSDSQQLNAYCNPKGRTISVFRLLRKGDFWYLILPVDLVSTVLKRLQLYKMRAKVELNHEENSSIIGWINLRPQDIEGQGKQWSLDETRVLLIAQKNQISQIAQLDGANLAHSDLWRVTEIISGIPQIYESTTEEFIPQHINLDIISAISFSKGCYPGQEIVARLRYLGKMKQRMIAGTVHESKELTPGEHVFTLDRGNQRAGTVVETVRYKELNYVLTTIPSSHIESGEVRIGSAGGPVLERLPLPYPVSLEKA